MSGYTHVASDIKSLIGQQTYAGYAIKQHDIDIRGML